MAFQAGFRYPQGSAVTLPIVKYYFATSASLHEPHRWSQFFDANMFLVFDFRDLQNDVPSVNRSGRVMSILHNSNIMETVRLEDLCRASHEAIGDSQSQNCQQQPMITATVQSPQIAFIYRMNDGKIRRIQVQFTTESDFQTAFNEIKALGCSWRMAGHRQVQNKGPSCPPSSLAQLQTKPSSDIVRPTSARPHSVVGQVPLSGPFRKPAVPDIVQRPVSSSNLTGNGLMRPGSSDNQSSQSSSLAFSPTSDTLQNDPRYGHINPGIASRPISSHSFTNYLRPGTSHSIDSQWSSNSVSEPTLAQHHNSSGSQGQLRTESAFQIFESPVSFAEDRGFDGGSATPASTDLVETMSQLYPPRRELPFNRGDGHDMVYTRNESSPSRPGSSAALPALPAPTYASASNNNNNKDAYSDGAPPNKKPAARKRPQTAGSETAPRRRAAARVTPAATQKAPATELQARPTAAPAPLRPSTGSRLNLSQAAPAPAEAAKSSSPPALAAAPELQLLGEPNSTTTHPPRPCFGYLAAPGQLHQPPNPASHPTSSASASASASVSASASAASSTSPSHALLQDLAALRGYSAQPAPERQQLLMQQLLGYLEDPDFVALCEDVENVLVRTVGMAAP